VEIWRPFPCCPLFYPRRLRFVCSILNRHHIPDPFTLRFRSSLPRKTFRTILWLARMIAQVDSLDEAKNKLDSLIRSSPGQYFVRDAENGKVIQRMGFSGSSGSEDEQSQS